MGIQDQYLIREAYFNDMVMEKLVSVPETGEALEYQDRVVTLSTCTENSYVRMTVQGKLVWKTS